MRNLLVLLLWLRLCAANPAPWFSSQLSNWWAHATSELSQPKPTNNGGQWGWSEPTGHPPGPYMSAATGTTAMTMRQPPPPFVTPPAHPSIVALPTHPPKSFTFPTTSTPHPTVAYLSSTMTVVPVAISSTSHALPKFTLISTPSAGAHSSPTTSAINVHTGGAPRETAAAIAPLLAAIVGFGML